MAEAQGRAVALLEAHSEDCAEALPLLEETGEAEAEVVATDVMDTVGLRQPEPEAVPVRDGSTMVSVVLAVCDFVGHQVINVGTALLVALAEAAWDSVTVALAAAVLLRVPHGEALRVTKPLDEALLKSDALACAVRLAETLLLLL